MPYPVAAVRGKWVGQNVAAYAGPFDGISFAALYGLKRFLTAYTGNLIRLRRDSDNAESDFGYIAATGLLDTAAIVTWLAAAVGFITTWYDQSGNARNVTQATAAAQPLYVASGVNSLPCADLDGSDDVLIGSATFDIGAAAVVANYEDGATFQNYDGLLTTDSVNLFIGEQGGTALYDEGGAGYPFTTKYRVNGTLGTALGTLSTVKIISGGDATPASGANIRIGRQIDNAGRQWGGKVPFVCLATTEFSAANHNTIGNALATLYGLSWTTVS